MNKHFWIGFFSLLGCIIWMTSLQAGEKIDKTLTVAEQGSIEIQNYRGKVKVTGWEKNSVNVKGVLDDLTEKFIFEASNNKTFLKVVLPDMNSSTRSGKGSNLTIFVPKKYAVQFDGVATAIQVTGIENRVDISSISGKIKIQSVLGKANISSVSGNIDLNSITGDIDCSTISGDVSANVSSKKLLVSGVSSNITISTALIKSVNVATVSGDTKLHGKLQADGLIELSNVSGDSFYYASKQLSANVELDTGPGGNIVNAMSQEKPTSSFIGSEQLKILIGEGNSAIKMTTVSGTIGLKKDK